MASLTQQLQHQRPLLLFENTLPEYSDEAAWLFTDTVQEIIATHPDEIAGALAQIDTWRQQGYYLAGYLAYEAAYALIPKLADCKQSLPDGQALLHFYVCRAPQRLSSATVQQGFRQLPESPPLIHNWHNHEDEAHFQANLERIRDYAASGDVYQVNHTFRAEFDLKGSINGLYQALRERQQVAFSALLHLPHCSILSLSPELFLRKQGNMLSSKPMKGTAKRGTNEQSDQAIRRAMYRDEKLRSENLMIVDLMRNDIGRLARPGSVNVTNLFEIQTYQTLHQMISTIQGEIDPDTGFAEVVKQLFPCGSITGAPKIRSMEIIHELENTPRGVYTGALGFITPENDFTFNVPIRTLQFPADSQHGTLGIGGGIIHVSDPAKEWQEALLKARFLSDLNQDIKLIETMRYERRTGVIKRLPQHLKRLSASAKQLGFTVRAQQWQQTLKAYSQKLANSQQDQKIRALLNRQGKLSLQAETLDAPEFRPDHTSNPVAQSVQHPKVMLHPQTIDADNPLRRHKTTQRQLYNQAYTAAEQSGYYDVLFLNQHNLLAEASRHNVMIELDQQLYTPPVTDGALPGVMRQALLDNADLNIREKSLTLAELKQAQRIWLCNSVRGVVEVVLG